MAETAPPSNQDIQNLVDSTLSSFEQFRIKRRNLRFPNEPIIGGGGFGRVHRAYLVTRVLGGPSVAVAVKKLYPRDKPFLSISAALAREVAVWAPLDHPNLLPFVGFHLDVKNEEAWLVSPYAEYGNILNYIHDRNPDPRERIEMVTDTIQGLHYLHTLQPPVCHGDIKPVNVLINRLGRAILCDLGLAQALGDSTGLTSTDFRNAATPRYQSPEIFAGRPRSLTGDIWAWGCLALELISGLSPYQYAASDLQVLNLIHGGNPPAHLDDVELLPSIRELLAACWAIEPEMRPTSENCLDVLTASDKEIFRQKSLWASPTVVDTLGRDLDDVLRLLNRVRLRRSLITLSSEDTTKWGAVRPAKMGKGFFSARTNVAVKILRVTGVKATCVRMLIAVIRELRVWSTLKHPNVLPLIGFYLSESLDEAWFISTLMPKGNLKVYIHQTSLTTKERFRLLKDVANGLAYLHGLKPSVCHGDVKPSNILVNEGRRALLCDFGLSRSMEGLQTGLTTSTFDQCRSIAYQSPELFLGKSSRTPASDVWAWGCVAHEIFSGRPPYVDVTNQAEIIESVRRSEYPNDARHDSIPVYLQEVLIECWQAKPELRPTAAFCSSALQCLEVLNIDRSFINNLEPETGGDWKTGHAKLKNWSTYEGGVELVVVRRVKILDGERPILRDGLRRLSKWKELWGLNTAIEQLFGVCFTESPSYFWLVSPSRPLLFSITSDTGQRIRSRYNIVRDLTCGLNYLHTQNPPFYHGRLSPTCVVIELFGHVRICDPNIFGLLLRTDAETREDVAYLSPEAVRDGILTPAGDTWAWGCIVQEVLSGLPPYSDVTDPGILKDMIQEGLPPAEVHDLEIPASVKVVIRASWEREPSERPLMATCMRVLEGARF